MSGAFPAGRRPSTPLIWSEEASAFTRGDTKWAAQAEAMEAAAAKLTELRQNCAELRQSIGTPGASASAAKASSALKAAGAAGAEAVAAVTAATSPLRTVKSMRRNLEGSGSDLGPAAPAASPAESIALDPAISDREEEQRSSHVADDMASAMTEDSAFGYCVQSPARSTTESFVAEAQREGGTSPWGDDEASGDDSQSQRRLLRQQRQASNPDHMEPSFGSISAGPTFASSGRLQIPGPTFTSSLSRREPPPALESATGSAIGSIVASTSPQSEVPPESAGSVSFGWEKKEELDEVHQASQWTASPLSGGIPGSPRGSPASARSSDRIGKPQQQRKWQTASPLSGGSPGSPRGSPASARGSDRIGKPPQRLPKAAASDVSSGWEKSTNPLESPTSGNLVGRPSSGWEKEMESLDRGTQEVHKVQVRLMREQMSTFIQELSTIQEVVVEVQTKSDSDVSDLAEKLRTQSEQSQKSTRQVVREAMHCERKERAAEVELLCMRVAQLEAEARSRGRPWEAGLEAAGARAAVLEAKLGGPEGLSALRVQVSNQEAKLGILEAKLLGSTREFQALLQSDVAEGRLCKEGLIAVRAQVADLETSCSKWNGLDTEMEELQNILGRESSARGTSEARLEDLREQVSMLEGKLTSSIGGLQEALHVSAGGHGEAKAEVERQAANMHARCEELWEVVGRHAELHQGAGDRLQDLLTAERRERQAEISGLEESLRERLVETLGTTIGRDRTALQAEMTGQHAQLGSRADALDSALKQVKNAQGEALQALLQRLEQAEAAMMSHHAPLASRAVALESALEEVKGAQGEALQTLLQRLEHAEASPSHGEAVDALHLRMEQVEADRTAQSAAAEAHHSALREHLDTLEADRTARSAAAEAHHSALRERLDTLEADKGALGETSFVLRERLDTHEADMGAAAEAHQSALRERLDTLEADRSAQGAATDARHSALRERLDMLEADMGAAAEVHHSALRERLDTLEADIGAATEVHHSALRERLDTLEATGGDEDVVEALHRRMEQAEANGLHSDAAEALHTRLQQVEADRAALGAAAEAQSSALRERVDTLEAAMVAAAEAAAEQLPKRLEQLAAEAAAMVHPLADRLGCVEQLMGISGEGSAAPRAEHFEATLVERLSTAEQALERVRQDLREETLREVARAEEALEQAQGQRAKALEELFASMEQRLQEASTEQIELQQRVVDLETSLGCPAPRHAPNLGGPSAEEEGSLLERMGGLKHEFEEVSCRHGQGLEALRAQLAEVHESLHACEQKAEDSAQRLVAFAGRQDECEEAEKRQMESLAKTVNSLQSFMDSLEASQQESHGKHAEALERCHATGAEHSEALRGLQEAHSRLADEGSAVESASAGLEERFCALEQKSSDGFDGHAKELESLKASSGSLADRLAQSQEDHQGFRAEHSSHREQVEQQHGSMRKRIEGLEQLHSDSTERHREDLQSVSASVDQAHSTLAAHQRQTAALQDAGASKADMEVQHTYYQVQYTSFRERLQAIEAGLAEAAGVQQDLDGLKRSQERHDAESQGREAAVAAQLKTAGQAAMEANRMCSRQAEELEAVHDELRQLRQSTGEREAHSSALEGLKKSHASLAASGKTTGERHAERLAQLEQKVADVSEGHAREQASAQAELTRLSEETRGREKLFRSLAERLDQLSKGQDQHHGSLQERLDQLEAGLSEAAGTHERALEPLKQAHLKHAKDLQALQSTRADAEHQQQQGLPARLQHAEQLLEETRQRQSDTACDLESLRGLCARFTEEERAAREAQGEAAARGLAALEEQQSCLQSWAKTRETELVEEAVSRSKDQHGVELAAELGAQYRHLADRVGQLSEELSRVQPLHGRVSACEARAAELQQQHQQQPQRDEQHGVALLLQRLDALEASVDQASDRNSTAVEGLRAAQAKFAKETKAREVHYSGMAQRLARLEEELGSVGDRSAQEAAVLSTKVDQLLGRIAACEVHSGAIAELRKAQAGVLQIKADVTSQLEALRGRISSFETTFQSTRATKQAADREKAQAHEALRARTDELHERLSTFESKEVARVDSYLQAAQARIDQMQRRLAVLESSDLRSSTERRGSAQERDDHMEATSATTNRHGQALEALAAEVGQLRTLHERVSRLEKAAAPGDLAAKQEAMVQEARDSQDRFVAMQSGLLQQLEALEKRVSSMQLEQAEVQPTANAAAAQASSLAAEVHELREGLHRQEQTVGPALGQLAELVSNEQRAREQHEQGLQGLQSSFLEHRSAQGSLSSSIEERLAAEGSTRERQVQELRESFLQGLARERDNFKEQIAGRHREALSGLEETDDRTNSLQRALATVEVLVRREIEDRLKESRRLWDAVADRTAQEHIVEAEVHRIEARCSPLRKSPQAKAEPEDKPSDAAEDEYLPFPRQPLTSFLRYAQRDKLPDPAAEEEEEEDLAAPKRRGKGLHSAWSPSRFKVR